MNQKKGWCTRTTQGPVRSVDDNIAFDLGDVTLPEHR